ncbi:MAG: glycogen debranching protein, partial [Kiritimatiellae bacterium]|nr:glycogen debranching protein [Kiritimatiellia bacterium]
MLKQFPCPGDFLLKWRGDRLVVELGLERPRKGRAALRTNLGHASVRRREIIAETERGIAPMAKAWSDIPMEKTADGKFRVEIALDEVGVFSGKACFFPEGSAVPEWPEGANFHVKVESADVRRCNSIYTVFPRQFGSFREVVRRLPLIMDAMGFRIIQTLPPFPVPTTYAVMGEYGCPFAALDFYSVDPAMAEFDESATPLDQFRELVDAVHARDGLFFVDLPANHTGWASVLQTSHPEWFVRDAEGRFVSPGAWGVKWADLVQLDYSHPELCAYMADVFLFWCRNCVDGFRCDAGYMIPAKTWEYIVARVREEYPDTVFMLEGLGGDLAVTDRLLAESGLDWAYSEIFQTYDRGGFDWYLPGAIARAEKYGALVHFAETHDNDRLAKGGETYARLRVQLAALLSWQGAWGIANGVEWFATEKIDVHGKNDLNWGAKNNMVDLVARLNFILATDSDFAGASHLEPIVRGEGNVLAVLRNSRVLVLAN